MATQTQLTWYGHSAFRVVTPAGKILLIDPWINNPTNPNAKEHLADLKHVDAIFLSHGHSDHVGDAVEIGKRTKAKLVANFDLGDAMTKIAGYPADQAQMDSIGHFGGELSVCDGDVSVLFVHSLHGSGVSHGEKDPPKYGGSPGGLVISIKNGPTIYFTGDTDVFSDMSLVNLTRRVNVMLVCMGDHFTMGPTRAAYAVKLVNPDIVVPMHYGTFPVLTGTPEMLRQALKDQGVAAELQAPKIGEKISLPAA